MPPPDVGFVEHPLRRQIVGEMHLRRWPPIHAPARLLQWLRLPSAAERAAAKSDLLEKSGAMRPRDDEPRHIEGSLAPGISFVWEGHNEATSLTLFDERPLSPQLRQSDPVLAELTAWAEAQPGPVIRATRIDITASEEEAEGLVDGLALEHSELVSCRIGGGARLWSDFGVGPGGYGRLVVAANGQDGHDLSRTLKRLQELGNYRNLALLGLPAAREVWPALNAIEDRLCLLGGHVRDAAHSDDTLLQELSDLSVDLVSIATRVNYRLSATVAYARLVEERLDDLAVVPLPGCQSLADFTQRRFLPAVRTCAALSDREGLLSRRAAQLSGLLRARIETRIEIQNAAMLGSMERSIGMQLRMQELVEGLSVVALSYYTIGLCHYLLGGLPAIAQGYDEARTTAVLVVPVVIGVWWAVRHLKGHLLRHGAAR